MMSLRVFLLSSVRTELRNIHSWSFLSCKFRLPEEAHQEFRNLADGHQSRPIVNETIPICGTKPVKLKVKRGQTYMWCACGQSNNQPLCDRTHANTHYRIRTQPVRFIPDRDGEVWLCMCKRTKHQPFCDGSHKDEEVQSTVR